MLLTLELSTSQLIVSPGFAQPVTTLRHSYGEGSRIEVHVVRDGITVTPTELEEFAFVVKPQGKYAATEDILAGSPTFTWDAALQRWIGEINYNVAALTTQLGVATTTTDEQKYLLLAAQLMWRVNSSAGWQRTQVIESYYLDNTLWKGTETFPSTGTALEADGGPWLTPLVRSIALAVSNSHATANTLADITPVTGPSLSFPVEAGGVYDFEFRIPYTAAATTTGARFCVNGPAKDYLHTVATWPLTSTTQVIANHSDYNLPSAAGATSLTAGGLAIIKGTIAPTADGDVIARFASEVSGSAISVKPGASVTYVRTV